MEKLGMSNKDTSDLHPKQAWCRPLRLNAVGDLYFGRRIEHEAGVKEARDVFKDADVCFANAEMLFHKFNSAPQPELGGTWSASPEEYADQLPWLGVNMAALPNNHAGRLRPGWYEEPD